MKKLIAIVALGTLLLFSSATTAGPIYPGGIFKPLSVNPNGPIYPPGIFSEVPADQGDSL